MLALGEPNVPSARGVGRYFDGLGAMGLQRPRSSYEGQVALEWNLAADPFETRCYPFEIGSQAVPEVDLRPLVRAAVRDLLDGRSPARVSARFHNTLARATGELVRRTVEGLGALPVVLTGGCFQNPRLAEGVLAELGSELRVYTHGEVPPGDGGIALGQALVADAVARSAS
jgi:hydrogenase maturation protein HypF